MLGGTTATACIGAINCLANFGGFVCPYLMFDSLARPGYRTIV
ncbi:MULTISPECIES: hypothetical protein [unclassified Cupriavidus]|nr:MULTISPECIES: hypothetical protein [unclassified Cupriavidus]